MIPECSCPVSGYCSRHNLNKNDHWHSLCQRKEAYRKAWDAGTGPGQVHVVDPPKIKLKGVGDFLHNALEGWGIKEEYGCACDSHRKTLNAWGPRTCKEHVETIVNWMATEAERRKMLFIRFKARQLVNWSIKQAEQEISKFKNSLS